MTSMIRKIFTRKVRLSEVVEPKPSRAATRVINGALKRAYSEQKEVSRRADMIRSSARTSSGHPPTH